MSSRDEPSMVNQQKKATGPSLVEKHACIVAPHDYHPQSHSHWYQEMGSDTCTLTMKNAVSKFIPDLC